MFILRFLIDDNFKLIPGIVLFILSWELIKNRGFSLKNGYDISIFMLLMWGLLAFIISLMNVGLIDALNGLRVNVVPMLFYFLIRLTLNRKGKLFIKDYVHFFIFSFCIIVILHDYFSLTFSGKTHYPEYIKNMMIYTGRDEYDLGGRSFGILSHPHASGLLTVVAASFIYINKSFIFKETFINDFMIFVFVFFSIMLTTYRTSLFALTLFLLFYSLFVIRVIRIKYIVNASLLLFCFVFLVDIFFEEKYINTHLLWWMNSAGRDSAHSFFQYIIVDSVYDFAKLVEESSMLVVFTGIGFFSRLDDYSMVQYISSNDRAWINLVQIFGVSSLLFIYLCFRSIVTLRKCRVFLFSHDYSVLLASTLMFNVILISNVHSVMIGMHGLAQLFYISLAIISFYHDETVKVRATLKKYDLSLKIRNRPKEVRAEEQRCLRRRK